MSAEQLSESRPAVAVLAARVVSQVTQHLATSCL